MVITSMTYDEFQQKYCAMCGTQLCGGVYDEELRGGCKHYREVYLGEEDDSPIITKASPASLGIYHKP